MTKPIAESVFASIRLNLTSDSNLPSQKKFEMLHDIKASSASFSMLIDEIAIQLNEIASDRALKKLDQLRRHESINKIVTELVVNAINDSDESKDSR